jgi:hypothetical protein
MEPESMTKSKTPASAGAEEAAAGLGVTPAERARVENRYVINLPAGGSITLYWNEYGERGASFRGFVPYEVRELVLDELRFHLKPRVEILENEMRNVIKKVV